jgi:hypothetical protein
MFNVWIYNNSPYFIFFLFFWLEWQGVGLRQGLYVAQAGLELTILLPQLPNLPMDTVWSLAHYKLFFLKHHSPLFSLKCSPPNKLVQFRLPWEPLTPRPSASDPYPRTHSTHLHAHRTTTFSPTHPTSFPHRPHTCLPPHPTPRLAPGKATEPYCPTVVTAKATVLKTAEHLECMWHCYHANDFILKPVK